MNTFVLHRFALCTCDLEITAGGDQGRFRESVMTAHGLLLSSCKGLMCLRMVTQISISTTNIKMIPDALCHPHSVMMPHKFISYAAWFSRQGRNLAD